LVTKKCFESKLEGRRKSGRARRCRVWFRRVESEKTNNGEEWAWVVKEAKVITGPQSLGGSNKRCMVS
jgi:hypothetical protein